MATETWDIDIEVYADYGSLPATGETGKTYADMEAYNNNPDSAIIFYKWNGSSYEQFHPAPRPRPH